MRLLYLTLNTQFLDTPPGRPVVAAIGSITENISAFVDNSLQDLVVSLASNTKDSMEFTEHIKSIKLTNTQQFLVTMDIEALYMNVPFEGGLQVAKYFIDKRTKDSPSTQCLLDLIECVLESNYFMYGTDYYLQVSRVAMGSKMSPSSTLLYVGYLKMSSLTRV